MFAEYTVDISQIDWVAPDSLGILHFLLINTSTDQYMSADQFNSPFDLLWPNYIQTIKSQARLETSYDSYNSVQKGRYIFVRCLDCFVAKFMTDLIAWYGNWHLDAFDLRGIL